MKNEKFWKTSISKVEPNKIIIRGYDLIDLIGKISFGDTVYLLMEGDLPKRGEGKMIEAILVAGCEHGLAAPSADAVRFVASGGVPLQASVAAGIIALGDWHGGAIEECARLLQDSLNKKNDIHTLAREIVSEYKADKKRIPGYGHPYHTKDPRAKKLLKISDDLRLNDRHIELALEIEKEMLKITAQKVAMNVDGAIAGIISDMGIDWRLGKGFYVIARSAGLVVHAYEQMTNEKPFKVVPLEEIDYTGPKKRPKIKGGSYACI